jgi:hypothetical protein
MKFAQISQIIKLRSLEQEYDGKKRMNLLFKRSEASYNVSGRGAMA